MALFIGLITGTSVDGIDTALVDLSNGVDKAMNAVKNYFRPEFLNRLSDICVFNPLRKQQLRQICSNQMNNIAKRLGQHGMTL